MADFVAVLKKTLGGLGETTPEIRAGLYDKARATIAAKLAAIDPPPPVAVAERQKKMLEDAIAAVESEFAPPAPPAQEVDPLAELENLFSSIDRNKNQQIHVLPTTSGQAPAPLPVDEKAKETPPSPVDVPRAQHQVDPWPGTSATLPRPAAERPLAGAAGFEPQRPGETFGDEAEDAPEEVLHGEAGYEADDRDDEFDYPPAESPVGWRPEPALSQERARRSYKGLIAALAALLVIGGGGYAMWLNKDALGTLFTTDDGELKPVVVKPVKVPPPGEDAAQAEPEQPAAETAPAADAPESTKFTQRLLPDGAETDPGPAGGASTVGEGSSVVALTTPPPAAAPDAGQGTPPPAASGQQAEAEQPGAATGQKAIYYEERTNVAEGSAESGNVVWSLVQESPGGDEPPEPAIRGEVRVPGKDVQLRMTIRRNADQTLPASHIIEMIFLTPSNFEGGSIDSLLRIALKRAEQDAGSPLIGIPAKIADGYFLVALNDTKADEEANLALLRNQQWIDVPVVYKSGRRALLTMEKGIAGDKVFDEAIKAWQAKTAG